ncbi:MAG: hypothetical protein PHQ18_00485 [Patescibacteria group bacterium]|nr:hypothetical protein [Patescibacteria group bacterium]
MGIDKPGPEPTEEPTNDKLKEAKIDTEGIPNYTEKQARELVEQAETRHAVVIPETKRDCEPEVAELETMFAEFESKHNLTELLAIDVMGPKGTPIREQRTLAHRDRTVIFTKMKKLKNETDISEGKMAEFIAKYDIINMAVGAIVGDVNIGKLDHSHREVTL